MGYSINYFYLNTNLYNNYDSKSPVDGEAKSDYGIVFGLLINLKSCSKKY